MKRVRHSFAERVHQFFAKLSNIRHRERSEAISAVKLDLPPRFTLAMRLTAQNMLKTESVSEVNAMKLKSIEISGMRSIANAKLELDGLTVLIGENGSGKSTILEAFEILRRCTESHFLDAIHRIHGGVRGLLGNGASSLEIAAEISDAQNSFFYRIELEERDGFFVIANEVLRQEATASLTNPLIRFRRTRSQAMVIFGDPMGNKFVPVSFEQDQTLMSTSGLERLPDGAVDRSSLKLADIKNAVRNIQLHAALDTTASWVAQAAKRSQALRKSQVVILSDRLNTTYENLSSVLYGLMSDSDIAVGERINSHLSLAFGERFQSLKFPLAGPGELQLGVKYQGMDRTVSAQYLSDGQLAYIALLTAFIAGEQRSLLAIDEPESHLHPALIARLVSIAETTAEKTHVILATHSRGILDALKDPAKQAVLCELNHLGQTELKRVNAKSLNIWLENYSGFGELIASGYASEIFQSAENN